MLSKPRTALIMVQAGKGTDAVIDELVKALRAGRHHRRRRQRDCSPTRSAARRRCARPASTSSAPASRAARRARSTAPRSCPAAPPRPGETLGPILRSIAAVAEGEPCVTHVGTDGAGHFVKMIHNGIEYADMQLIAEAYDLIRRGTGKTPAEIADVFAEWNKGELESYLIEITAEVLRQVDAETGKPLVDVILDQAGVEGHRRLDRAERPRPRRAGLGHRRGRVRPRPVVEARPARRGIRPARPGRDVDGRRRDADAFIEDVRQRALRVEDHRLLAGLRRDRRRRRAVRLGHQEGRHREDLARRVHHPRPLPQPHHRGVRGRPRARRARRRPVLRGCRGAARRRRWRRVVAIGRAGRHPDARVLVVARLLRRPARGPPARPRSCRASATSSARTPTSASTRPAPSTPCGRATAARSRRRPPRTSRRDASERGGERMPEPAWRHEGRSPTTASPSRTSARSSPGSAPRSRSWRAACSCTSSRPSSARILVLSSARRRRGGAERHVVHALAGNEIAIRTAGRSRSAGSARLAAAAS